MTNYEGKRWAVIHVSGFGQNQHAMYFHSWDDKSEQARLTDDRYRAKTWATLDAAERNARNLGRRYEAVEVYL